MNKLKRALSLILCAAMLISLLPTIVLAVNNNEKGTCTITTTGGTIYKLVAQPEAGKTYLILNSNAAGSANALSRNGNNIANQTVTVKPADTTSNAVYVADIGSATVWTAGNGLTFMNSDRYLTVTRTTSWNNVTYSLGTGASGSSFTYNTGNKTLSSTVSTGNWWEQTINVYVGYNNGWTANTSSGQVYFYEAVSTSGTATYSLTAENQVVAIDDSIDVAGIAKTVLRNGVAIDAPQGGTYSYEIRSGEDTVLKLENGKLTGVAEGTATVRVKYTWGDNDENVVWADIAVQVSGELFYTVDIKSGGNSANVLSVKGVTNETTRPLTADVLKYGTQTVDGATVAWTSSDTSIVAVNENGLLTFTGKEGIATIFAVYQDGEEEYIDQITVTASTGIYIIPADGTNDFPEYPNEGSIRFDKTAVSVGNFNDTGLAQVELSVTGVPYSKGVDVIVMLDMSSSMTRCINCGLKRNDSGTCGNFKSREDELKDAMQELQNVLQASDNAANIRIAVADFNGTQSFGATQYNANSHTDRTQDVGALTNGGKQKVYTGTVAGEVNSMDASRQRLSAAAFIPVSELNVKNFNYTPSTGTNYDYAFDAVYQLGYAIKQKNIADNDPDRELFVIFMSDGASNQFNYYNTTGGRSGDPGTSDWDKWLTGSIGADRPYSDGKTYTFAEIIECTTHSYYFDEATGNQHRMANAIKGNPNQKYEVIRKNQNLNQGLNSGGNDAVTAILESAGKDNLYWIPGLGATTYTLAFYVVNDGNISGDSAKHSLRGTASSPSHYIEAEQEGAMGEAFKMIAGQIIEAAKDVKITDQMANEYTMVFEAPNEAALEGAPGQEYYIEILDYQLDPNTHERTGSGTSLMKLYMGSTTATDGTIHYHAASDSQGTAYPAPVFEQKALGAMYYWTTEEDIKDSPTYSGVSVTVGDTTYYFDTNGRKQGKDEPIPENWYNMTSGAYASGTITVDDHEGVADGSADDTNYCKDLIIATPHFVYNANEVNGRNKMLYWTLEKIGRNETVMRYFLYLDDSGGYHGSIDQEAGTYPTNEGADLTYTNFQDNRVQQEFPIPQMTWHGAQMSYVFYLVNEQGQPVNRAGRVVPFSEAIYVTDVYTKSVTWSGNDKQEEF